MKELMIKTCQWREFFQHIHGGCSILHERINDLNISMEGIF